jgi:hypothetical protein
VRHPISALGCRNDCRPRLYADTAPGARLVGRFLYVGRWRVAISLQCGSKAADAQQVRRSDQEGGNSEESALINQSANAKDAETVDETVSVNSGDVDTENWVTNLYSGIR